MSNVVSIMQFGATGPVVAELQNDLRLLGFDPGENMGIYDNNTTQAVANFQRVNALVSTGDADAATVEMIKRRLAGGIEPPKPAAPPAQATPLSPTLATALRDAVKSAAPKPAAPKSTALVPKQYVGVISDPTPASLPFYKQPVFLAASVLAVAGIAIFAISQSHERAFESFEDAEGLVVETEIDSKPEELGDLAALAKAAKMMKPKRRKSPAKKAKGKD